MLALVLAFQMAWPETPYAVAPKMPDVMVETNPSQVHIEGYIGARIRNSEENRLLQVDLRPLLEGFHHQPGSHPWIGEHIGKWIHAATLAWANTGDEKLKAKLDAAVKELISCQQADGYLGTYVPEKRFGLFENADWDVWVHKYDLLGLLTYYRFTGDKSALRCCERIGDLLCSTFGPGKKSILSAGTHMGMAATSVLEPTVLLYRSTGNPRYLDFAKYIVGSWEEKGGPHIMSTLEAGRPIDQVGNGKAYEMLSNLVGLCELARATGEKRYLRVAKLAWADVVKHELYITGTASYYEHFHPGDDLPNATSKNIGETCVTVTWMQLSQQLLRLTGEAKYAEEFERSEYNHLAAAQKPDGSAWCYYTSLQGTKPYTTETCCCLSSGPRGMAIIPETAYMTRTIDGIPYLVVNTCETSRATVRLGGRTVKVSMTSDFPASGKMRLLIDSAKPVKFGILVRKPNGSSPQAVGGWTRVPPRNWRRKSIDCSVRFDSKWTDGHGLDSGKYAAMFGPFAMTEVKGFSKKDVSRARASGLPVWEEFLEGNRPQYRVLVPFAEAGARGESFRVWQSKSANESAFQEASESRSAEGNVDGSICDGDPDSCVVTFNGKPQESAWFAVNLNSPVVVSKLAFVQGGLFHDGGWFDTSKREPEFQVQIEKGGNWIKVAPLVGYPKTTASDRGTLKAGQTFTVTLLKSLRIYGLRVEGAPASGDNPKQAFASCAELQAFP